MSNVDRIGLSRQAPFLLPDSDVFETAETSRGAGSQRGPYLLTSSPNDEESYNKASARTWMSLTASWGAEVRLLLKARDVFGSSN